MASVIVSFRFDSSEAALDLSPANELAREAQALGGAVCAFAPGAAGEIAFVFDAADVDLAVELAAKTVRASSPTSAGTPARARRLRFTRAGIAEGPIETFLRGDAVRLVWGSVLGIASTLAMRAEDGEILLDGSMKAVESGALSVAEHEHEVLIDGQIRVCRALVLASPVSPRAAVVPAEPRALPTAEAVPAEPTPIAAPSLKRQPTGSFQLLELAREAFVKADDVPLDDIVAALKLSVENADVVERLAGVLAMTRGAKEEGLRLLRRGAEAEVSHDKRARAVLAYAIGVAAAGRHEDSLLEALTALAVTRELGDKSGEKACARFLARLSSATGHPEAASAWEHVALRIEPEAP